jgi:uncharacterized repeat protein (TIGR03803 family)
MLVVGRRSHSEDVTTDMKTWVKKSFVLPVVVVGLGLMLAGQASAQTFTTLHSFTASSANSLGVYTNIDGASPSSGLVILSGNTLYGTAAYGGGLGYGTVFKVKTDGTGFTNLHNCTADSAHPNGALVLSGNTLYGTTGGGRGGTVFAVNTDGTGFTNLYSFGSEDNNSDGKGPNGFTNLHRFTGWSGHPGVGLILSSKTLYGTTEGTVFAVSTNGTGFTTLYNFSDGARPTELILSGNTLYGAAESGGASGNGTVFNIFIQPQLTIISADGNTISDLAYQLLRLHSTIHHKPCFIGLDNQPSGTRCGQRAEHGHESHNGHTAVLPVEPVIRRTRTK